MFTDNLTEFSAVSSQLGFMYNILNSEGKIVAEDQLLDDANVIKINLLIGTMVDYLQTLVPVPEI